METEKSIYFKFFLSPIRNESIYEKGLQTCNWSSLPPLNAPQIRPIEQYWGILKQKVHQINWSAQSREQLIARIKWAVKHLTLRSLSKFLTIFLQKFVIPKSMALTVYCDQLFLTSSQNLCDNIVFRRVIPLKSSVVHFFSVPPLKRQEQ